VSGDKLILGIAETKFRKKERQSNLLVYCCCQQTKKLFFERQNEFAEKPIKQERTQLKISKIEICNL
jgi:ubiquinone biosynthesis protein Coq4